MKVALFQFAIFFQNLTRVLCELLLSAISTTTVTANTFLKRSLSHCLKKEKIICFHPILV